MSTKRQRRSRQRLALRHYAFAYLNVSKLPVGVPAVLREYLATLPDNPIASIPAQGLNAYLAPFRKPYRGL